MSKQIFLSLNEVLLLNGPNYQLSLANTEERILNYRNGIRAAIKQRTRASEIPFFEQLQSFYKSTEIPLLKAETSIILFEKFNRSSLIFKCLLYLHNQIKNKQLRESSVFCGQAIQHIAIHHNVAFQHHKQKLDVFIRICKRVINPSNVEQSSLLFKFMLNQSEYAIKDCLSYYQLGSNIVGHQLHTISPKHIARLDAFLTLCKQDSTPFKYVEFICIEFLARIEDPMFAEDSEFTTFYLSLIAATGKQHILSLNYSSLQSLYFIYKHNPGIFSRIDYNRVTQQFNEQLGPEAMGYARFKLFSSLLVEALFKGWGISIYFAKHYINGSLNKSETQWMIDLLHGKNLIYSENLPFKLSKKVAHSFNNVEGEVVNNTLKGTVTEGLFMAAINEQTNDPEYASVFNAYNRNISESNFWINTAILLYRQGLRANTPGLTELIDYIRHQTFNQHRLIDFTKKKLYNLRIEAEEWHNDITLFHAFGYRRLVHLPDYGIKPFEYESNGKQFVIKQLKTNKELVQEGISLKHCVGIYTNNCVNNGSYIFSLREICELEDNVRQEIRHITIEVNRNRIIQQKGKANRNCNALEAEIISAWRSTYKLAS